MKNKKVILVIILLVFAIVLIQLLKKHKIENIKENANNNFVNTENIKDFATDIIDKNYFEGIILEIDGSNIRVENPSHLVDYSIYEGDMKWHNEHSVNVDGKLCVTAAYVLCLDNVSIMDSNKKEIGISDLKVGDTINVFTRNLKYTVSTIFSTITSENIELIEKKSKS